MLKSVKLLGTISRAEFLLPNLGSLIMGLAWGAVPSTGIAELVALVVFSFTIINLSSAIGAQANTLSDRELDAKDERKKQLGEAMNEFGAGRLKKVMFAEGALALLIVFVFILMLQKPVLLILWIVGISLGCAYSLLPTRLKSRSWLAPVSLILVLAVFPVLFAYYSFINEISFFFLFSLLGLALTVYAVIVPTEIRDYFGDKAMGIETMTVRLGLVRASALSIVLLAAGGLFTGAAFFLEWLYGGDIWLSVFLILIPVAGIYVLLKLWKLCSLSKKLANSKEGVSLEKDIVDLSADNPKWIMVVTQTYSAMSVILLLSKFLF